MRRFRFFSLVASAAVLVPAAASMAVTNVTLPTGLDAQSVLTDTVTGAKDYILIGGIGVIVIMLGVRLLKGLGKKAAGAVK